MAISNGYATQAEFEEWLGDLPAGTTDAILEDAIESASRHVDGLTGDLFYPLTGATFVFTPNDSSTLSLAPSLRTVTTLKTDDDGDRVYETTWATTDYDLEPLNASIFSRPYTSIRLAPNGRYAFSRLARGVQIVGDWGWATAPDPIKTATLILAARLFGRKNSPLGVAGSSGIGEAILIGRSDPDVMALVAPYRRFAVVAV